MLFILLDDLLGVRIKLEDLLVGAASEEDVLLVISWVELDTEWHSLVGEGLDHFACLGVPQLYDSVKTCTEEPLAIVCEADISDCFLVAYVSSHTLTVSGHVPDLALAVVGGA